MTYKAPGKDYRKGLNAQTVLPFDGWADDIAGAEEWRCPQWGLLS